MSNYSINKCSKATKDLPSITIDKLSEEHGYTNHHWQNHDCMFASFYNRL